MNGIFWVFNLVLKGTLLKRIIAKEWIFISISIITSSSKVSLPMFLKPIDARIIIRIELLWKMNNLKWFWNRIGLLKIITFIVFPIIIWYHTTTENIFEIFNLPQENSFTTKKINSHWMRKLCAFHDISLPYFYRKLL